jgi:hypothetical protein
MTRTGSAVALLIGKRRGMVVEGVACRGGAWSAKEGKWRWKTGTVDEGEHHDAFYRVQ